MTFFPTYSRPDPIISKLCHSICNRLEPPQTIKTTKFCDFRVWWWEIVNGAAAPIKIHHKFHSVCFPFYFSIVFTCDTCKCHVNHVYEKPAPITLKLRQLSDSKLGIIHGEFLNWKPWDFIWQWQNERFLFRKTLTHSSILELNFQNLQNILSFVCGKSIFTFQSGFIAYQSQTIKEFKTKERRNRGWKFNKKDVLCQAKVIHFTALNYYFAGPYLPQDIVRGLYQLWFTWDRFLYIFSQDFY